MSLHKNLTPIDVHVPYSFTYADATARNTATGLTINDVGKFARQLDDNSIWMLVDHVIITWVAVVGGSTITSNDHKKLRQLIHLADGGGPFEGFISGAYRENLPSSIFPTSIIWYEDITKTKKIVEKTVTYNANKTISLISWKAYDTDGTTILATVTDAITYVGIFESNRTRTII